MYVGKVKGKEAKRRNQLWFARDRADGVCSYWDTESEARAIAEDYNSEKRRRAYNLPPTNKAQKKYTVRDLIRSYLYNRPIKQNDDLYHDKDGLEECSTLRSNFVLVLWSFSERRICEKTLFQFNRDEAEKYIATRLTEAAQSPGSKTARTIKPSSVYRNEITELRRAWDWARINLSNLSQLENPWRGIDWKRLSGGAAYEPREQTLQEGELEKLIEACDKSVGLNRYYLKLAISLAAVTGLRRQEIINLEWKDIDFKKRHIWVQKSKTHKKPINIAMPDMAAFLLAQLAFTLKHDGCLPGPERQPVLVPEGFLTGRIFEKNTRGEDRTGESLSQAFDKIVPHANLRYPDLNFHDLRASANELFIKADLDVEQRNVMMRHTGRDKMNAVYTRGPARDHILSRIQDKLDKYTYGKTLKEIERERDEHQREFERFCEEALREGLDREASIERATAAMLEKYPSYAEIKTTLASLPSTQARLAEEEA